MWAARISTVSDSVFTHTSHKLRREEVFAGVYKGLEKELRKQEVRLRCLRQRLHRRVPGITRDGSLGCSGDVGASRQEMSDSIEPRLHALARET
ncbi:MAG: hypothetical protein ACPIOQ_21765 [Promethearchaeia archaeon]